MSRAAIEISQEVKEQMWRDYRRGTSVRQIASIYGIGQNKAYRIVQCGCEIKMGRPSAKNSVKSNNIKQDFYNGLGVKKMARKYGYCVESMYRFLRENGIDVKAYGDKRKHIKIISDLELGELTQSEIARKYNVSRQYVSQVKKTLNNRKDKR